MTKYARISGGRLIDVWRVPDDFPTLEALNASLPCGGFIAVPDDAQNGAEVQGDGTYSNPVSPVPPEAPAAQKSDMEIILERLAAIEAAISPAQDPA